jgi:hypothetical protein
MIPTPDLIDLLASRVTPVRRLRRPAVRAALWLLLAMVVVGMLVVGHGLRPDFWQRVREASFVIGIFAMVLTGICAAIAAFMLSLPDRPRRWAFLPLPAFAVWVSTIGYQCLTNWVVFDPAGMRWGETARCFSTLVLASLPLSLAILVMLRYAAPLRPTAVTLTAGLAVSAITATAMALIHDLDASIMILMWNFGTAAVIVGLGGMFGRRMLAWAATRLTLQQG